MSDPDDLQAQLDRLRRYIEDHDEELSVVDDHIILYGRDIGTHDEHLDEVQYDINQLWKLTRYLIERDAEREKLVAEVLDLVDHVSRRAAVWS